MSGVFNLCDILQFIIDRLYQGAFSEQDFVRYAHQRVLHVILHFGYQLYAVKKKILEQGLPDIPLVRAKFTLYVLQNLYKEYTFFEIKRVRRITSFSDNDFATVSVSAFFCNLLSLSLVQIQKNRKCIKIW